MFGIWSPRLPVGRLALPEIPRWAAPSARFHNVDVFVLKEYDVFKEEYMFKSCVTCLLWRQKQIT